MLGYGYHCIVALGAATCCNACNVFEGIRSADKLVAAGNFGAKSHPSARIWLVSANVDTLSGDIIIDAFAVLVVAVGKHSAASNVGKASRQCVFYNDILLSDIASVLVVDNKIYYFVWLCSVALCPAATRF